jgi:outer membrane protein assembly factor BamB
MRCRLLLAVSFPLIALSFAAAQDPSGDWPWWRGPARDGSADPKNPPPMQWSEKDNVVWKSPVAGKGHGSPIVVGDRVFLATADEKKMTQSVLCYSRSKGDLLWETVVHEGKFVTGGNGKSSHASSTPACDGERVYINFANNASIYTSALTVDGKQVWQTKVSPYILHQGFASSPTVYGSLVLVASDNKGGGAVAGLDRKDGSIVWKQDRPKTPNYASPIVVKADGKDQLILIGCDVIASFDPTTGKKNWETPGSTTECVTSTVSDGAYVFSSGGYPKNHIAGYRTSDGTKAWEINTRLYVPSFAIEGGYLYAVTDGGLATCWKSDTGKEQWKERLDGTFSSSVVRVGDVFYATNEAGKTTVFKANPKGFERLAENQLGNETMASPAIAGGQIFLRATEKKGGQRQEWLYCIGKK